MPKIKNSRAKGKRRKAQGAGVQRSAFNGLDAWFAAVIQEFEAVSIRFCADGCTQRFPL
jgi:hypothetical protein